MYTEDDLKKCGVYIIENIKSLNLYIGSTSGTFRKRWLEHLALLRRDAHHNTRRQRSWNKHGSASFEFRICEITLPEHTICVEQVMIDYYLLGGRERLFNSSLTTRGSDRQSNSEQRKLDGEKLARSVYGAASGGKIHFGQRLEIQRLLHGMTQKDLAMASGTSESALSAIENGKRNPGVSLVLAFAAAIGISIDDFYDPTI